MTSAHSWGLTRSEASSWTAKTAVVGRSADVGCWECVHVGCTELDRSSTVIYYTKHPDSLAATMALQLFHCRQYTPGCSVKCMFVELKAAVVVPLKCWYVPTLLRRCTMKCCLLRCHEKLFALSNCVHRTVYSVSNGLGACKNFVVIASLQQKGALGVRCLNFGASLMMSCYVSILCSSLSICTAIAAHALRTSKVLSPKKWISSYSLSTYCRQYVLSQPWGKISKLICPPMEYVSPKCANLSLRMPTNFFLQQAPRDLRAQAEILRRSR